MPLDSATKTNLQFLKIGGSLITDKHRPRTLRPQVLSRLADEIARALGENPGMQLVVGNGAGSFGHVPAKKYGTRDGVRTAEQWRGFAEVWREAAALNAMVTEALHSAGLPAIAIHPSGSAIAQEGKLVAWDLEPVEAALQAGLIPVVHGDVAFDRVRGGTILSTEDLFGYLALHLKPARILQAGLERGVWEDYPACTRLIPEITPKNLPEVMTSLRGSSAADVTGGMASKVIQSLALIEALPDLEVLIFSGETPGSVYQALCGETIGTRLHR